MMQLKMCVLAAAAVLMLSGTQVVAQNLLVNPGFEDPITTDGPPFVGFWEGFQGSGAFALRDTVMPRSGEGHLALVTQADQTFAGAFQDVEGLVPGQLMDFSLWHKTLDDPYTVVSEMRIEWRKVGQGPEISRIQILPVPTLDYTKVSLVAPVPAGADTARVVYAIQTFTNGALSDMAHVYVDDASLTVVPEPTTAALLLCCALPLALRRRWIMTAR
jgi:hypothetical protein